MGRPFAYTAVVTGDGTRDAYIVGRADQHVAGHTPCPEYGEFNNYAAAKARADALNHALGLTPIEAWKIVATTMRPLASR